jgi:hypothetical protein
MYPMAAPGCEHRRRTWIGLALTVSSLCAGPIAFADEPVAPSDDSAVSALNEAPEASGTDMCVEAHTQSQELRQDAKLLETRAALLSCSAATCPGAIRLDCSRWLEEVQAQIPSVGFRATAAGQERVDVQVFIDGKLVLERLRGKALELNPGVYQLRLVPAAPLEAVEQQLVMSEGDRFRVLSVELRAPEAPAPEPVEVPIVMERPVPTSVYIFAGIGTAAAISGAVWGLSSWTAMDELEATCAPGCPEKTVDVARQRALISDISWGVSAATFITAGMLYFLRPEVPRSDPTIDVALLEGGAMGVVNMSLP